MLSNIRERIIKFSNSESDKPFMVGFICGFYPFIYYFAKYFNAKNSLEHLFLLAIIIIGIPLILIPICYFFIKKSKVLAKHKEAILFMLIVMFVATMLSEILYLKLMKKALVLVFVLSLILAFKFKVNHRKLIVLLFLMSAFSFASVSVSFFDWMKPLSWQEQPDDIENIYLKKKPNIYLIQPDGYVGEPIMKEEPYAYESELYSWLEREDFKVYPNFRSNYPATLTSNTSMFSMKQHLFGNVTFPAIDMINSRDVISGDNPVISIFKKNNYKTFFVVQDEFFQENNCTQFYDYRNIDLDDIPLFCTGGDYRKDVFDDLKKAMSINVEDPKFFFIENLMPHHVFMFDDFVDLIEERNWYIDRVEKANIWIRNTVNYISKNDPEAIIIVLADHGGMAGIETYKEKYTNNNETDMYSIFSNLAAIKWNGNLIDGFDDGLKSNVNLFRVLFSVLSHDKRYLDYLEDDSSYNLNYENPFYNSVYRAFDDDGNVRLR